VRVREAARVLRLSDRAMRAACASGRLPARRLRLLRAWLVEAAGVDQQGRAS
jgi:hypothetical protein